jgi:hypothetical protein
MDFNHYISLEDSARSVTFWAANLIPGLLQTSDYRRVLAWAENPAWTPVEVERRVELASKRQQRLQDPDFTMTVFLSEAALRNQVGSDAVMEERLTRLVEMLALPNITIRVVPFKASNPVGPVVGSFVLLEFPLLPSTKLQEPPVVYVEGHVGDLYLEREGEITQYRGAVDRISRVALDPEKSRKLILEVAKEYAE